MSLQSPSSTKTAPRSSGHACSAAAAPPPRFCQHAAVKLLRTARRAELRGQPPWRSSRRCAPLRTTAAGWAPIIAGAARRACAGAPRRSATSPRPQAAPARPPPLPAPHLPPERQRLWTYFKLWPNVAFDLCGICCGHFLMPFWTFFGATFIGKAVIRNTYQSAFIVAMMRCVSVSSLLL